VKITFQSEIIKSFKKYCRLGWNRLQDCYHGLHNLPRLLPRFTLKVFKILNQESDFQTCQLWLKISGFSEISGFSGNQNFMHEMSNPGQSNESVFGRVVFKIKQLWGEESTWSETDWIICSLFWWNCHWSQSVRVLIVTLELWLALVKRNRAVTQYPQYPRHP